ncbi:cytochrome b561 and DOMON domain-containing protein [Panicum miliaceum]|uniref:Cytochrome b561 and DOMON domain-containing protein n=1 Tax=Panicum miliaceum TaxID=4540 RepID=A0A3L6TPH7_PANMI|nr:cytochrome b561 and DOMON domain-containing protein [Panicum miliaceum]
MATNCGFCNASLHVLGASVYWTYHPVNGTADVAFPTPQSAAGWVAWGIDTERPGSIAGSSAFITSQDGNDAVSVLNLDDLPGERGSQPHQQVNNTLKLAGPVEHSGGAYTIYAETESADRIMGFQVKYLPSHSFC